MKKSTKFAKTGVPLYYQLENVLRQKILSGDISVGERLPTEVELSLQYHVSRITVRQALASLVRDGLIERRQGSGTYIKNRDVLKSTASMRGSFQDLMKLAGETKLQVLEIQHVQAGLKEAEILKLEPDEDVTYLKAIRFYQNTPYALVTTWIPDSIGMNLEERDFQHGSLLSVLEKRLNIRLTELSQTILADLADAYTAPLLEIRVGSPLLCVERVVFTAEKRPVVFTHTLYRSDILQYSVKMVRDPNDADPNWSFVG